MKIAIGCDHRGLNLKQQIAGIVAEMGHTSKDFGCYNSDSVDYPDIAKPVAEAVASGAYDRGILICGTGIGMSIAANKVKGARAALCYDAFCAYRARLHNDTNILALGTEQSEDTVREIINKFLTTDFEGGRHLKRIRQIAKIENKINGKD